MCNNEYTGTAHYERHAQRNRTKQQHTKGTKATGWCRQKRSRHWTWTWWSGNWTQQTVGKPHCHRQPHWFLNKPAHWHCYRGGQQKKGGRQKTTGHKPAICRRQKCRNAGSKATDHWHHLLQCHGQRSRHQNGTCRHHNAIWKKQVWMRRNRHDRIQQRSHQLCQCHCHADTDY